MTERLYRHPTDRAIAGVAAGIAAWLNIDPTLVRVAWVLLAIFSGGAFVLVYIVMMIVVPLPPPGWTPRPRDAGWGGPTGAWGGPASSWGQPGQGAWGPTAAPRGAPSPPPGWGEASPGASAQPSAPAWGDPAAGATPGLNAAAPGGAPGWLSAAKPGNAGIVAGTVLVFLGVWFLVDQYVRIDWDMLWPVIIMVIGGALIAGALLRSRDT